MNLNLTADIVAAYLASNKMAPADVPTFIATIAKTLGDVVNPAPEAPAKPAITPAQIRKSITDEALVSFVDGRRYRTLKRHLGMNGLTPEAYRAKFGLPKDYPMTAPDYSRRRSELAKATGLGQVGKQPRKRTARKA